MSDLPDRDALIRPLLSLVAKSEKALLKLSPGGWQHTMLSQNLHALHLAIRLLDGERLETMTGIDREESLTAQDAFAKMIGKTEQALSTFTPGTSQHTLLKNRVKALRCGEVAFRATLAQGLSLREESPLKGAAGRSPRKT